MGAVRRGLERLLEGAVIGLTTALAAVVLVAVGFRKAGASLVWYDEVATVLLVWLTYYGAALAALKRAHLGFPRIVRTTSGKARATLMVLRETVVIAFFGLVAWAGWWAMGALGGLSLGSLPWLSTRVSQSAIPIGAILFVVAELLNVAENATSRSSA
jgi:TRAP-type C4-dicarboxylate transport system permease small subunit